MGREKHFTIAEVARHAQHDDIYLIYENSVYDVTRFLDEHPGGVEVINDYAGKDATEAFDEVGHSKEAHQQLEELLLGRLDQASAATATAARSIKKKANKAAFNPAILYSFAIATGATAMAGYWYFQVRV
ncbi:cytochrome b5-like heme/steroid binding domain-containing protein [Exophiala viscosa]|uniref:Cytochrome b5-like heme/steroid binding domain-containing protein n=1 Tax=Exophiala viscosa TaxID=2486360 RepID=A0AAN6DZX6_9EURO|nr:cytochrome b5-like heme/steroid binding domain-containing protein [Exophiala viscosa]KAI1621306.1 cytochrome b5-like heme/steroid binding domain-containing protein [Exophiala viscosa]